jgi:hypothetical protein
MDYDKQPLINPETLHLAQAPKPYQLPVLIDPTPFLLSLASFFLSNSSIIFFSVCWASGRNTDLYAEHAIGLMLRRTRTELIETIERSRAIYSPLGWKYNETEKMWRAPNGARLRFAYLERDADAELYQGHSYTRLYVEEIGTFPSPAPIFKLMATLRSSASASAGRRAFRRFAESGGVRSLPWRLRTMMRKPSCISCTAGGQIVGLCGKSRREQPRNLRTELLLIYGGERQPRKAGHKIEKFIRKVR